MEETRNNLSKGASALLEKLGGNGSDSCRGIILAITGFMDKWRSEAPTAWEAGKALLDRSLEARKADYLESSRQGSECMRDAEAMRDLILGLSAR
jgi:hypothetical protein